jgi:hypothetical protein
LAFLFCGHYEVQQFPPLVEVSAPLIGPLFLRALQRAAVSSPSGGFMPSNWPFSFCGHYEVQQFPPQVEVSGPLIGPSFSAGTTTCSSFLPEWRFRALWTVLLILLAPRRAAVILPPLWGASRMPTCYPPRLRFSHILPFYRGAQHGSEPRWCIPTLLTHASLCAKFIAFIIGIASYGLHHDDRPC